MEQKTHHSEMLGRAKDSMVMDKPVLKNEKANLAHAVSAKISWQDKLTNGDPPELILWGSDVSVGGAV